MDEREKHIRKLINLSRLEGVATGFGLALLLVSNLSETAFRELSWPFSLAGAVLIIVSMVLESRLRRDLPKLVG